MEPSKVKTFWGQAILGLMPVALFASFVWVADAATLRIQRSSEQYTDKKIEALEAEINHRLEKIADRQDEVIFLLKGRTVRECPVK